MKQIKKLTPKMRNDITINNEYNEILVQIDKQHLLIEELPNVDRIMDLEYLMNRKSKIEKSMEKSTQFKWLKEFR